MKPARLGGRNVKSAASERSSASRGAGPARPGGQRRNTVPPRPLFYRVNPARRGEPRRPVRSSCQSASNRHPLWVRLREKGGKPHAMPCHHSLETHLTAYIEGAGLAGGPKGPLFATIGRGTGLLTRTPLPQRNAHAMIRRRAAAAGIAT